MAKLLETLRRQVTTWWGGPCSALRANPRRRILPAGVLAVLVLLAAAAAWQAPKPASCDGGLCQCWYCEDEINSQCYVDGHPSSPIGCVGACAYNDTQPQLPGDCSQVPGQGGCGPDIIGCRSGDCPAQGGNGSGNATPTPTPVPGSTAVPLTPLPPTPTPRPEPPIPAACGALTPGEVREWTNLIPPTIADPEIDPDHPVVVGQDPDKQGFRIHLVFRGGRYEYRTQRLEKWCGPDSAGEAQGRYPTACGEDAEWHYECPVRCTECYNDPLDLGQIHMRLADSTKAWIEGELAARYPGTRPLEGLPQTWQIEGLHNQMQYDAWWVYKPGYPDILSTGPIDPGIHGGRIVVSTTGTPKSAPQTVQAGYEAQVFLMDTTIAQ